MKWIINLINSENVKMKPSFGASYEGLNSLYLFNKKKYISEILFSWKIFINTFADSLSTWLKATGI